MLKRVRSEKVKKHREFLFFSILWSIIKKNIKLVSRSKSSSLIVVLGPLIIIALVGAAFNTSNIYDIRIGAYSSSYSKLADSVLDSLGGQQFSIIKYDTKQECVDSVKFSQSHVCVLVPPDLDVGQDEPLNFHVDQSRVNLVWIVIDAITSRLGEKSEEISLQLTSSIIGTLKNTEDQIKNNEEPIDLVNSENVMVITLIDDVSEDLSAIDPDLVAAIDLGKISQKLEETITTNNLSVSTFSSVFRTISNIKNNTENVGELLFNATVISVERLENARSKVDKNIETITLMKGTLGDLMKNIDSVTGTSAEDVVTPLRTKVTPVVIEKTHLNFLFPSLIILIIMLISLLLSSGLVIREKTSTAFFRSYITPARDGMFLLGHFLTNSIIISLQLIIIFVVASFFFKNSLVPIFGPLFLSLIFIITVFVLIGMLIGYLFRSEETAMLATISLASLFLFFSGTILPLETIPESLKRVADFNPFVISEGILKKIMLFQSEFVDFSQSLMTLFLYILIMIMLVYGAQRFSKTRVE